MSTDPRELPVPELWRAPINDWTCHLRAAGRSAETIRTRTDHLRRAARALGGGPWLVEEAQLVAWVGAAAWARETRRSVYASLRGFWAWGVKVGRCATSPAADLPSVKPGALCPRPVPDRAYRTALMASRPRERLILELASQAGLRRGEVAQVHRSDMVEDLLGWSLVVHGKGGKDRTVPLPDALAASLTLACAAGGGWAFPGAVGGHLSAQTVGILGSRALPDGWTLHKLRHRFASRVYAVDRDLIAVQQLLGHASVATTQRYVAPPADALRRAVEAAA